ncbi:hypothetical protein LTR74_014236 [Friedmanniomyces endolithicus]|nr:hypothetical protein LTR74_014236 [Friedmanniomyces endolithicus]
MAIKHTLDESDERISKCMRSDYNATITVLVGLKEVRFTVHQDLLCSNSDFFKKACSGDWTEAPERVVRLAHTNVAFFQIYVEQLYRASTDPGIYEQMRYALRLVHGPHSGSVNADEVVSHMCRLWALGDFLQDAWFQSTVIDELDENPAIEPPSGSTIEWVANNTTTNSPLAKWLLEALVPHLGSSAFTRALLDELTGKLPADFLMSLLKATVEKLS